jgi:hypothetical protein
MESIRGYPAAADSMYKRAWNLSVSGICKRQQPLALHADHDSGHGADYFRNELHGCPSNSTHWFDRYYVSYSLSFGASGDNTAAISALRASHGCASSDGQSGRQRRY